MHTVLAIGRLHSTGNSLCAEESLSKHRLVFEAAEGGHTVKDVWINTALVVNWVGLHIGTNKVNTCCDYSGNGMPPICTVRRELQGRHETTFVYCTV